MNHSFETFCHNIHHTFVNNNLLEEALTHPSLSKEHNDKPNYQRLEFLGDKVLSLVIADFLMQKYKDETEGDLSKRQASLVSGETLSDIALKIGINDVLLISKGEKKLGGYTNKRNLENALEALIGAIYTDCDYEAAKKFILHFWEDHLSKDYNPPKDPVSQLQELVQSKSKELPDYRIEKSGGLDHAPRFLATLKLTNVDEVFSAEGKSKKEAQKKVAEVALAHLLHD